jgi:2-succinyl-6-hydroxy-2,4-cyclohexadiene-1-carboxylate synthase
VLHREIEGPGTERVVLVHGFTQTLRSWDGVAGALGASRQVVRIDLPGHGGSGNVSLGFAEAAAAVGEAGGPPDPEAEQGPAAYVGYSMGGRLCLRLALDRPDLVSALVLVGASPGLADPDERAARRRADEDLATSIEAGGTAPFLERWLASPLFAGLRPAPADLAARRANRPEGLAGALRLLGSGAQDPLWPRLSELAVPALAVAGAEDAKFAAIARRMAEAAGPAMQVALVADAGHAAHLERPEAWLAVVEPFLDRHHTE